MVEAPRLPRATRLYNRKEICALLTEAGFPIKPSTIAGMASIRGGGPPMKKFGNKVFYDLDTCLAWARNRLVSIPAKPSA